MHRGTFRLNEKQAKQSVSARQRRSSGRYSVTGGEAATAEHDSKVYESNRRVVDDASSSSAAAAAAAAAKLKAQCLVTVPGRRPLPRLERLSDPLAYLFVGRRSEFVINCLARRAGAGEIFRPHI